MCPRKQLILQLKQHSNVPSKKPRHSNIIGAPGGAADHHLQQKQQPFVHQQAAGTPQKPPQLLQNGRLGKFAKHSKHAALAIAGVPPRECALGGADLTQNALKRQQGRQKASLTLVQVWKLLFVKINSVTDHCRAWFLTCLSITTTTCYCMRCAHDISLPAI